MVQGAADKIRDQKKYDPHRYRGGDQGHGEGELVFLWSNKVPWECFFVNLRSFKLDLGFGSRVI